MSILDVCDPEDVLVVRAKRVALYALALFEILVVQAERAIRTLRKHLKDTLLKRQSMPLSLQNSLATSYVLVVRAKRVALYALALFEILVVQALECLKKMTEYYLQQK